MFDELRHNVKYSTIYSNSTFNRNVASDAQVPATTDYSAYQFGTHVKEKTMKVDENVFLRGDPAHMQYLTLRSTHVLRLPGRRNDAAPEHTLRVYLFAM